MRHFTVQEANAFVPALEATFGRIDKLRFRAARLVAELNAMGVSFEDEVQPESSPDGSGDAKAKRREITDTLVEIKRLISELESHGLIVKQIEGLVDFRSLRGQRPVFLCWRKGEDRVQEWHEVGSDDDLRRPIDHLFPKPLLN